MAEFITKCPHCNAELQAQDEWIDMEVECPLCKANFMIVKSSTGKKQCDFAKNNSFTKRKLYVVSIAIIIFIAIVITSIILCNDIGTTTSPAIKTEENTVQKNKRLGLHFNFKWGYLMDDLDQTEFKSLTTISDLGYVIEYKIVTKSNYQYTITVNKSSRKISLIFSEDPATVKAFIAEVPNILKLDNKTKENEKANGYYLNCADDDVFLVVSKNDENKKVLIFADRIYPNTMDQYFEVASNSF